VRSWTIAVIGIIAFFMASPPNRSYASSIRLEVMTPCIDVDDPPGRKQEAQIDACTAVIQSPHAWPSEVAKAYASRGAGYITIGKESLGIADIEKSQWIPLSLKHLLFVAYICYPTTKLSAQSTI
jgi:hypothetical protein